MNIITQLNEKSRINRQKTQGRINRLPFSGFIRNILRIGITLALVFAAVKAYPFVMAWFRQIAI